MDFLAKVIVLIAAIITLISKLPELGAFFSKTKRAAKKTRKMQSTKSKQSNEVTAVLLRAKQSIRGGYFVLALLVVCLFDFIASPKPLTRFDVFAIALDLCLIMTLVDKIQDLKKSVEAIEIKINTSN